MTRFPIALVNQRPIPARSRSMYGIAAMNVSQIVGTMTPARPLSMWSRSSWRLSRYQGAFDGLGVQSTVEWSCSGALKSAEIANRPSAQIIIAMNSMTSRCGQTIAVSSTRLSTRTTESCLTKARSLRRFSWPGNGCGPRGGVIRALVASSTARRSLRSRLATPARCSRHARRSGRLGADARSGSAAPLSLAPFVTFAHSGPLIPPSLRMRQKWMAIRKPVASG